MARIRDDWVEEPHTQRIGRPHHQHDADAMVAQLDVVAMHNNQGDHRASQAEDRTRGADRRRGVDHRRERTGDAGPDIKEQKRPAAKRMLAGHTQNEEHHQVADQMLGVGVHESSGDEPPDLSLKHLVAIHGAGGDDAVDVGETANPKLLEVHDDAAEHQGQRHGRNYLHARFEINPLPMKHVLADGRDVIGIVIDWAQQIFAEGPAIVAKGVGAVGKC